MFYEKTAVQNILKKFKLSNKEMTKFQKWVNDLNRPLNIEV